ncbi:MAG: molybdopterin guanine dinucleotide synthesis [Rhodobacterales bacterium]
MMGQMFDSYIVVDWSANGTPKTGRDSLWIAQHCPGQPLALHNPPTRALAMDLIARALHEEARKGRRVLAGFDFAFGYPAGLAQAIAPGADWRDVWGWLHDHLTDGPDNANNRFDLAADLNALFDADGPFWGNGLSRDIPGLPRRKPTGWGDVLPDNRRLADRLAPAAQEVWKLSGAGSVGGQSLTGIAALERLRRRLPLSVWPFDPVNARSPGAGPAVLAEVFPSAIPLNPALHPVRDAAQVIGLVRALADWDANGRLSLMLQAPQTMPAAVRQHEAMILGLDPEQAAPCGPIAASAGFRNGKHGPKKP